MCMVTSGTSRCHARTTTSDARVGTTSDASVAGSYHKNFYVSQYLYDLAISQCCHKMCMVTSGTSRCHAQNTTSDGRLGTTSDEDLHVSQYLYDLAISGQYLTYLYYEVQ